MQLTGTIKSAFFITFNGDCKKAFTIYQECFGGYLSFETFNRSIDGIKKPPVVFGSLVSGNFTLYGSDLVHNEGRRVGNFLSIYIHCGNAFERLNYLKILDKNQTDYACEEYSQQKLIEIADAFQVRWIFGI